MHPVFGYQAYAGSVLYARSGAVCKERCKLKAAQWQMPSRIKLYISTYSLESVQIHIPAFSPQASQNALPTLEAARAKFKSINGDELVNNVFRPFFVDGGMEKRLGLAILHRHFDLNVDERLVDYNGTSLPWPTAHTQEIEEPYASIWSKAADGTFRPTEYRYSQNPEAAAIGPAELNFMEEFDKLLQQHGASDLFGLCLYPGDDFEGSCEITVGRANINLKPAD
ncbi:hypothetical protein TRV_07632, partial [Trichophyton verrucosum HKI 0517]